MPKIRWRVGEVLKSENRFKPIVEILNRKPSCMKKNFLHYILWLVIFTGVLSAQTVYITNTGEKYHISGCRYLHKSKISIELSDALAQGYTACKVCRPTQTIKTKKEPVTESRDETIDTSTKVSSSQCSATTKSGARCKRLTKSSSGKCWQHGGE